MQRSTSAFPEYNPFFVDKEWLTEIYSDKELLEGDIEFLLHLDIILYNQRELPKVSLGNNINAALEYIVNEMPLNDKGFDAIDNICSYQKNYAQLEIIVAELQLGLYSLLGKINYD
ncbi:MAG: hypothetical protein ABIF10_02935 [Candidatus Woesearchaeota archaeon]